MKSPKTLLEWLKGKSEAEMKVLTGYDDVYPFMQQIRLYSLLAFDTLPVNIQLYILKQYCEVYKQSYWLM